MMSFVYTKPFIIIQFKSMKSNYFKKIPLFIYFFCGNGDGIYYLMRTS